MNSNFEELTMKKIRKLLLATTIFLASTTALADETFVYIGDGWALVCNLTTNVCEVVIF